MIWILWAACLVLAATGIFLATTRPFRRSAGDAHPDPADDPLTYIRRIAGVMLAAFGLTLGILSALYHYA